MVRIGFVTDLLDKLASRDGAAGTDAPLDPAEAEAVIVASAPTSDPRPRPGTMPVEPIRCSGGGCYGY